MCPAPGGFKMHKLWLTASAAPKNKKGEKMSLGDFLGDQGRLPLRRLWRERRLTAE